MDDVGAGASSLAVGLPVGLGKRGSLWSEGDALPTELVGDAGAPVSVLASDGSLESAATVALAETSSSVVEGSAGSEASLAPPVPSKIGMSPEMGLLGAAKPDGRDRFIKSRFALTGALGGEGRVGGTGAPAVPFVGGAGAPPETGRLGGATGTGTPGGEGALTGGWGIGRLPVGALGGATGALGMFSTLSGRGTPESVGPDASPVVVDVEVGSSEAMSEAESVGTGDDTGESVTTGEADGELDSAGSGEEEGVATVEDGELGVTGTSSAFAASRA